MRLRYYLLLVPGLITTLVICITFALQGLLLQDRMTAIRDYDFYVHEKVEAKNEKYREKFVSYLLAKKLAQINSILEVLSKFKSLGEWFSSSEEHREKGTWIGATGLIQQEEWIDFLQNTADGKLLSLVIPEKGPFFEVKAEPIEEGLSWVHVLGTHSYPVPFLGIEVPFKELDHEEVFPKAYFLYHVGRLQAFKTPVSPDDDSISPLYDPFSSVAEIDESQFFSLLQKAIAFVQNKDFHLPLKEEKEETRAEETIADQMSFKEKVQRYLREKLEYSNQLFLNWQLAALQQEGAFQVEGTAVEWPDAVSFSFDGKVGGEVFFIYPILGYSSPVFDDQTFFNENAPKDASSSVSSGSRIIKSPIKNQAFLVNTASIATQEGEVRKESLISIGVDLGVLLEELVQSFQQYGFIVSQNKVLVNKPFQGMSVIPSDQLEEALKGKGAFMEGTISLFEKDVHFSRFHPDPETDLYFIFLRNEGDHLAVFYDFQKQLSFFLRSLRFERLGLEIVGVFVLWMLLLYISKKITKPIVSLAASLDLVKKGEWDRIQLPKIEFSKKNEIKLLYDSFYTMIQGLKEKEKVTAILNKVVSEDVAKEILKGDIKLGGEEKFVTMLFGDIRGFTNLTQNMAPHDVIGFLNKCMTKVSEIVESHQGVIDKYMGDGVMAIYGAPIAYEDSAMHAIISGLEMVDSLRKWNVDRIQDGLSPIYMGIGIHTGSVCAGNMGARHRLNYTVIGSNVNMASRLCSSAEAEEVLITEATYLQKGVKEQVDVEDKGMMSFKGFDEKIQIYKVVRLKEGVSCEIFTK